MNDLLRHTSLLGLRPILCTLAFAVAALCSASSARAPLGVMMEPVINQVPYDENDINLWPVSWFLAEPGEVYTYGVGYPSDPVHNIYNIENDTDHTMTGLALRIVGTAVETGNDDPEYIFDRGAPTEAIFGDVTGDQQVISDIFQKITISKDRKFILLTDGEIPPGARFTDISLSKLIRVRNGRGNVNVESYFAVDSSFLTDDKYFPGDVNGDGVLDHADSELARRLSKDALDLTPSQIAAGDFNNTGKIDIRDVKEIQRLIREKHHTSNGDRD
ncbi:MAG: dockerin type I repeat-containing protein [Planctomycetales bacterium]|nr:dockerin type I repeat-containing protein [Planctomycetales bacterium]